MNKPAYYVASFSGGKDSTAMVLRLIELGRHIDEVVCCDTYKEFPAMYRHIEKAKRVVESHGIKFTFLRCQQSFDYLMFEHYPNRKNEKLKGLQGYSWPGSRARWCTSKLKIDVIDRYLRKLEEQYEVIQYIGIAADEQYRLERENNQNETHIHPLVEWGWDEKQALQYCYSRGFDWEGLYEIFSRVSCWCCPLQSMEELRKLRKHYPDLWEELKDMDRRTWRKFRADYSVEQLEMRFSLEEEMKAKGLPTSGRSKLFQEALKKRLNGQETISDYCEQCSLS